MKDVERTVASPHPAGPAARARRASWDLTPYVQVLRSLLPRVLNIVLFDARGEVRWSNEAVGPDLLGLQEDLLARARSAPPGPGELRMLDGEQPLYVWWLWDDAGELLGFLAMTCRPGREEHRAIEIVHPLVRPILECLRRELLARTELETLRAALQARDQDLQLIIAGPRERTGADGRVADEIDEMLQSANTHLRCVLSTLIVPERGLVVVRPASGRTSDHRLLARTHRQLLAMAQTHREALVLNRPSGDSGAPAPPYRILLAPLVHPSGRVMGVLATFRESADREFTSYDARIADGLARRAAALVEGRFDEMTGLLTRTAFERRARAVLEQPGGVEGWSALFVDADQLHAINEAYGMHVGDRVIAVLGDMIRRSIPPGGFAARLSGGRFTILVPTLQEPAARFGEALCAGARQLRITEGGERIRASVSVGVAAMPLESRKLAHTLAEAEAACKAAKDRGRGRVELYTSEDSSIVRRFADIGIAANLQEAMAEGRLRLYAQSIGRLAERSARSTHMELLLRMVDASGEMVGPDRFFSAAHRYELMPTIDRWVLEATLGSPALRMRPALVVGINLSGQSLLDEGFEQFVIERIRAAGIDPRQLCFEVTESAAMAHVERTQRFMQQLRRLGCGIALDDFGAGLSSLGVLRELPVTMLKIDGSFVREIARDERSELLVRAIGDLARTVGIVTVAESVETEEIRNRLVALGIEYGQGFAMGRPQPWAEVVRESLKA